MKRKNILTHQKSIKYCVIALYIIKFNSHISFHRGIKASIKCDQWHVALYCCRLTADIDIWLGAKAEAAAIVMAIIAREVFIVSRLLLSLKEYVFKGDLNKIRIDGKILLIVRVGRSEEFWFWLQDITNHNT